MANEIAQTTDYANVGEMFNDPQFQALPDSEKVRIFQQVSKADQLYQRASPTVRREFLHDVFFPPELPEGAVPPEKRAPPLEPRLGLKELAGGPGAAAVAAGLATGALTPGPLPLKGLGAVAGYVASLLGEEGVRRLQEQFGTEVGSILGLMGTVLAGGAAGARVAGRAAKPTTPTAKVPPGKAITPEPSVPPTAAVELSPEAKAFLQQAQAAPVSEPLSLPEATPGTAAPAVQPPTSEPVMGKPAVPSSPEGVAPAPPAKLLNQPLDAEAKIALTKELLEPQLRVPVTKKTFALAEDVFRARGLPLDPTRRISDQVMDLIADGHMSSGEFHGLLEKHGLTEMQFARDLFREVETFSARNLAAASVAKRRLKAFFTDGEAKSALDGLLRDVQAEADDAMTFGGIWRRASNAWKGFLVSQWATAARNLETQGVRLGLDVLQTPLDAGIQKLFGLPQKTHPLDGLEALFNTVGLQLRNKPFSRLQVKQNLEAVFKEFPDQRERLLGSYSSDIISKARQANVPLPPVVKAWDRVQDVTNFINIPNRAQEFMIRRGSFQAALAQRLRARGVDLEAVIQRGEWSAIQEEDLKFAADKSLDVTFATQPKGEIGRAFVDFFTKVPGMAFVVTFPRFMTNAWRFLFEYNPTGLLKYTTAAERAKFAAGDTTALSKAALGSGMLLAAWQLRNSEYAGEKWYEVKDSKGNVYSTLPFNPFAAQLFIADVIKRMRDGTLDQLTSKDVAFGVLSTNLRAGTGVYMLDKLLEGLTSAGDFEKFKQQAKEFGGEIGAGFATPLQMITDLLGEFDRAYRVPLERRLEPGLGPIKNRAPFLTPIIGGEPSPEAAFPTRATAPERIHPFILRQGLGLSVREPKTPIEAEFDRLGFSRQEVLPSTGDPAFDYVTARYMGRAVDKIGDVVIDTKRYKAMSDKGKAVMLSVLLSVVREDARNLAKAEQTAPKRLETMLEDQPRRLRALLRERGIFEKVKALQAP